MKIIQKKKVETEVIEEKEFDSVLQRPFIYEEENKHYIRLGDITVNVDEEFVKKLLSGIHCEYDTMHYTSSVNNLFVFKNADGEELFCVTYKPETVYAEIIARYLVSKLGD